MVNVSKYTMHGSYGLCKGIFTHIWLVFVVDVSIKIYHTWIVLNKVNLGGRKNLTPNMEISHVTIP